MADAGENGRDAAEDGPVSVEIDVENGRTVVSVTGEREAAVVVYSASGERIYLPPERVDSGDGDPYRPVGGASPYGGAGSDESPYDASRRPSPSVGMIPRSNGFRIVHPEPVTDFRLLR